MTCYVWRLGVDDLPWAYGANWQPYSAEMVQGVKTHIPSRARRWQPEKRRWVFRADQLDTLLALADTWCDGWQMGEPEAEPARLTLTVQAAYGRLWLRPGAPATVVKAVYRALCKELHPDAGGDNEAMGELNAAYALLERSFSRG